LSCIASTLIEKGFSVNIFDCLATSRSKVIDLPTEMNYLKEFYGKQDLSAFGLFHHFRHFGYSFGHLCKILKESNAFLVGISSLFTAYHKEALITAETVKKVLPESKVVLGGHHPTAMPEKVMENKAVDFVIRGEGELSMPMLARAVQSNKLNQKGRMDSIPGLVYFDKSKKLRVNKPAMVEKLGNLPIPAIQLINNRFYKRKKRGGSMVVTSRGCPMKCSYCCVGSDSLKYRQRDVSSVIDEIKNAVYLYDAAFIDFEDENISMDKKWFIKLLKEITSRFGASKLELRAMNGLFPPSLDEEVIVHMKRAGFKTLNLSVGSTSKDQLKKFLRPDVTQSLEEILIMAKKHYLKTVCYIIVAAPGQKAKDSVSDMLYFLQRNVVVGVSVFYPAPGSRDYELCSSMGILPHDFSTMRSIAFPLSHTTTRLEAVTLLRLGRIQNFIKRLVDKGLGIPGQKSFSTAEPVTVHDRINTGRKLFSWFLNDGIIRGVTREGEVYEHKTDLKLTGTYIKGLKAIIAP
jgi:anaerobic magnesium-protoporphyrin IX monomethyl ester cyclase